MATKTNDSILSYHISKRVIILIVDTVILIPTGFPFQYYLCNLLLTLTFFSSHFGTCIRTDYSFYPIMRECFVDN